jgi:glycosyltransferase involved in cell wall biosynthesis
MLAIALSDERVKNRLFAWGYQIMGPLGGNRRLAVLCPGLGGGIGRVMVNLVKEFVLRGIEVDLLLAKTGGPYAEALAGDVRLFRLFTTHLVTGLPQMVYYLRKRKPDALLTDSTRVNVLALRARRLAGASTRIYTSVHNTYSKSFATFRPAKMRSKYHRLRRYYPRNDGIIAVSKGTGEDLSEILGMNSDSITVIPNPVVTEGLYRLAAEAVDHPWFQQEGPSIVMNVARLHPQKDQSTLLHAFASLRQKRSCRLIILGEGEERPKIEALARELGVERDVSLPGFRNNPYAYMAKAHLFVLSSAWEGFGNVLVEAMALGLPVVSTDCPHGPKEILKGGEYGHLVPVGDADALSDAMLDALENPPDPDCLKSAAAPYAAGLVSEQYLRAMEMM